MKKYLKDSYIICIDYLKGLYLDAKAYLLGLKKKIKGLIIKLCDYKIKLLKKVKHYCK